jgi:hypothetical protein
MCEHCAGPTRATSNTKHTTPTEERGPVRVQKGPPTDSQGEVSKASEDQMCAARERTGAVGGRRGCHDPCTRIPPRGSMQEGKRTWERRGRHSLACMVVTVDTSQRPMSWSNEPAFLNTAQVPHATQSNTKHTTPTEERGPVRVQKGPPTDSQGEVSKESEDRGARPV